MQATDTLPLLGLRYYNDPMKWEVISHFNGMDLRDLIHDGDLLLIPEPIPQPVKIPVEEVPTGGTVLHDKVERETSVKPRRGAVTSSQ